MFEQYSEKARRAIFFARYECSNYGSPQIESEHLLLGLLRETVLLQRLLKTGRESIEVLRKEIENHIIRRAPIVTNANLPITADCKRILGFAAEEASLIHQVQPEHLLIGLLREETCLGARILQAHEVTLERVRDQATRGTQLAEATLSGRVRGNEWCCAEFQARCYQPGKREDGLGILFLLSSKTGTHFLLEYRRPDRTPPEPIAADGTKLKFCPWCGCNLAEWYGSRLPPFEPST